MSCDDMKKPEPSGTCENCLRDLEVGQVILIYNDVELHADCDNPYSLDAEKPDEGPMPSILLNNPLENYPVPNVAPEKHNVGK